MQMTFPLLAKQTGLLALTRYATEVEIAVNPLYIVAVTPEPERRFTYIWTVDSGDEPLAVAESYVEVLSQLVEIRQYAEAAK